MVSTVQYDEVIRNGMECCWDVDKGCMMGMGFVVELVSSLDGFHS